MHCLVYCLINNDGVTPMLEHQLIFRPWIIALVSTCVWTRDGKVGFNLITTDQHDV